jgi:hypothetical protein
MKKVFSILFLFLTLNTQALTSIERKEFLDAIRPQVESLAGQPVKFVVSTLNHQDNWFLLIGHLVAVDGKDIDWEKAKDCEPTLDKTLWVIAEKTENKWRIDELFICSPEPPYWYLEKPAAFSKPCGLYAGLRDTAEGDDLQGECKQYIHSRKQQ